MIIKLISPDKSKSIPLYNDLRKRKPAAETEEEYYCEPQVPVLPDWTDKIYYSQGFRINLFNLECKCSDHKKRRELYDNRDVRLCCKHLFYKLTDSAISKHLNSLVKNLIYAAARMNVKSFYTFNIDKKDIYFGLIEGSNWIQTFSPVNGSYARFGYNPELDRWVNGMEPENAWKMEHIIKSIVTNK